ncbi:MAG: hypothetical protein INQ03_15225 [Candidatus Heimdallarchaeota archaeon]|nr:hypothetical protein [Candidatus Heimdallarchaeota archaeon]
MAARAVARTKSGNFLINIILGILFIIISKFIEEERFHNSALIGGVILLLMGFHGLYIGRNQFWIKIWSERVEKRCAGSVILT